MERHGDFLKHLENSRRNDPWEKNLAFKTLTPVSPHSSCQFIVASYIIYITAILSLHTLINVLRSCLSQDRTSNNCCKPSGGRFFPTPFWAMLSSKCIQYSNHHPTFTTSASVRDTPEQGAHTSCHFRSNEKVRWLEPRHSWLLKLRALAEQKISESGVHGFFAGRSAGDRETWNTQVEPSSYAREKSKSMIKPPENQKSTPCALGNSRRTISWLVNPLANTTHVSFGQTSASVNPDESPKELRMRTWCHTALCF